MTTEFILAPGEEFVQCPYNPSHRITNTRFPLHLEKCRKAYIKNEDGSGRRLAVCRHNAAHHYPLPEIKFHESQCPDAASVLTFLGHHNSSEAAKFYEQRRRQDIEVHVKKEPEEPKSWFDKKTKRDRHREEDVKPSLNEWGIEEEDWEAEADGYQPGYDPKIKLKSDLVMYVPSGLTKTERKQFRNEVRSRHEERQLSGALVEMPLPEEFKYKPYSSEMDKIHHEDDHEMKPKVKTEPGPPEPGEIIDSDEDFEVIDFANQASPPRRPSPPASTQSFHVAGASSTSTSFAPSSSASTSKSDRSSSASAAPSQPHHAEPDQTNSNNENPNTEPDEDEPWPWPDDGRDHYSDDSDDFEGRDPY